MRFDYTEENILQCMCTGYIAYWTMIGFKVVVLTQNLLSSEPTTEI